MEGLAVPVKDDLIGYVWHPKHAVEQTFMAPLGIRSLLLFVPLTFL